MDSSALSRSPTAPSSCSTSRAVLSSPPFQSEERRNSSSPVSTRPPIAPHRVNPPHLRPLQRPRPSYCAPLSLPSLPSLSYSAPSGISGSATRGDEPAGTNEAQPIPPQISPDAAGQTSPAPT